MPVGSKSLKQQANSIKDKASTQSTSERTIEKVEQVVLGRQTKRSRTLAFGILIASQIVVYLLCQFLARRLGKVLNRANLVRLAGFAMQYALKFVKKVLRLRL